MKENKDNQEEKIIQELEKVKTEVVNYPGKKYYRISVNQVKEIGGKFQLLGREIEILALKSDLIPERYHRNLGVISPLEQVRLLEAKVAIIGLGGLGGTILELLTRLGIGKLIIADQDIIAESNLNRQILSKENNLGKSKVEVAIKRAKEINSSIEVIGHAVSVKADNASKIIEGAEVVVDALDNVPSRLMLQKACQELHLPLVHGAIAGFNGQLTTVFPEDQGLELIYGANPTDLPERGSEVTWGTPPISPALIASLEAQEVIKILLKRGKLFRNKLLYLDLEEGMAEVLDL